MARITGTTEPDYLTGGAGDDHISGGDEGDRLYGGDGDDLLEGEDGADWLDGGYGNDVLVGGEGDDYLHDSTDSSVASPGSTRMFGGGGNDFLDVYLPGTTVAHDFLMDGGEGNDRIQFSAWHYTQGLNLIGGGGDDIISISGGRSLNIDAGSGADVISFNFSGSMTEVKLSLGEGADILEVRRERFTDNGLTIAIEIADFEGGPGGDRIIFDSFLRLLVGWDSDSNPFATGHLLLEQRGTTAALRLDFNGGGDAFQDFILFEGVAAADLGLFNIGFASDGSAAPGLGLDGGAGADELIGSGHSDLLRGLDGDDTLIGNSGDDRIEGGLGADQIDGGWGDDSLHGDDGDDRIYDTNSGNDSLYGGDGKDVLSAARNSTAPFSTLLLDGGAGDDTLYYGPYNEVPYRRFVDDVTMIGGDGNDVIDVNSPRNATIDAGAGNDRVGISTFVGSSYTITLGSGGDLLRLQSSTNHGTIQVTDFESGVAGDSLALDSLLTSALIGWDPTTNPYELGYIQLIQRGSDSVLQIDRDSSGAAHGFKDLIIFAGADSAAFTSNNLGGYSSLVGTEAGERLEGDAGSNSIRGLGGDDVLIGNSGKDGLSGGDGSDRLDGGDDSDRLDGGAGADTMIGGRGDDLYFVDDSGDLVVEENEYETSDGYRDTRDTDEVRTGLSVYTLPLNVARLTGLSDAGQALTANGGDNTVRAGAGNDFLYLLGGSDAASGGGGDDRIEGGEGNDLLEGAKGSDLLIGGEGNDVLLAGYYLSSADDSDRLEGGAGDDRIEGHRGSDVLLGGADKDSIIEVESGQDLLDGGDGDDIIYFHRPEYMAALPSTILGGDGDDKASLNVRNGSAVSVDMGAGSDTIVYDTNIGSKGAIVTVTLGAGRDVVSILDYDPGFDASAHLVITDFQTGESGDRLDITSFLAAWLTGWDKLSNPFGTGHLRIVQSGTTTLLQADRNGGADSFLTLITFDNADAARFTPDILSGYDSLAVYGTASADIIRGSVGNDRLYAGDGADSLRLVEGGDDSVFAGAGNDNIFFIGSLDSGDVVDGGEGSDTLILQGPYPGGISLTANVTQIELISILAGSNTNFGEPGTNRYDYVLTTHDSNFAPGIQARINGSALLEGEDFTFDGSAETDARFVVYGGRGKDTLIGGQNNDIFFLAEERFATGDTVNGGAGYDGMFLRGNYTIDFNAPGYTGLFANIENLTLTSASDERYARGGGTEFDYNLVLSDAIVKPGETLTVSGTLLMAGETMILDASAETDGFLSLFGGKASDTLKGGALADVLHGNLGADQLTGNGGADLFRYNSAAESTGSGLDQILDFAAGVDKMDLARIDAHSSAPGDQAFTWIGSNAFSGSAGQLRAYQDGSSWFVEGDTNGDGVADLVIQLTVTGGPLSQNDFLP